MIRIVIYWGLDYRVPLILGNYQTATQRKSRRSRAGSSGNAKADMGTGFLQKCY